MGEADTEILPEVGGLLRLLVRCQPGGAIGLLLVIAGALARHIELRDAHRQVELRQLIESLPEGGGIERIAVQVPLHANPGNWNAHVEQAVDMFHVVRQPVAGQNVVIVDEQLRIGIALLDPQRHFFDRFRPEPLLVIVGVDHLVIEIVLRETAPVPCRNIRPALPERHSQFFVAKNLEPVLDSIGDTPEDAVAAQRKAFLLGPCQHAIHHRIVDAAGLRFHGVPFESVLRYAGVEVAEKDGFELRGVIRVSPPVEDAVGKGRAEPELVADLFDRNLRAGSRPDYQRAHPISCDGCIQIILRLRGGSAQDQETCRKQSAELHGDFPGYGLYVLEKLLRLLVTVKLPSRRADTLIQLPWQSCAFMLATNCSGAFNSAPAVTE